MRKLLKILIIAVLAYSVFGVTQIGIPRPGALKRLNCSAEEPMSTLQKDTLQYRLLMPLDTIPINSTPW